ncbi:MAG: glycosyltransferase family 4 protein [Bacteroidales bacterium]|nr:glycosyltransferase family 4 protein [Bacteroidales bacterium]
MMKRVLCLIESIGSGGAERQLTGLAVMLKQQGCQIELCYYDRREFYLPYLQENGVESCFLKEASDPKKRYFALRKQIRAFKPDTVISYSTSPSMITCLLRLLGAKFNLIVSERNTTQRMDIRERLKFLLYRWADHIVPNSQSQASFIGRHFPGLSRKVKVITNFVDTEKFSPAGEKLPEHEETSMVCVGRLTPQKNLPRFIGAIGKVVGDGYRIRVDWYGQSFDSGYREECDKAIVNHHLEDVFVFHAPSPNIQDEYRRADLFCLPSLYEGFPNVLCEAMSCGKPVLCSRVCDNPHIVSEGENGCMFDPLDVGEMASTIEHFLELDRGKREKMGARSRELALGMFSEKAFIKKYISII